MKGTTISSQDVWAAIPAETSHTRSVGRDWTRIVVISSIVSFLVMAVLVVRSAHRMLYDETNSWPLARNFHEWGFTAQYLRSITHGSGPLYGILHGLLWPLNAGEPYRMRIFNLALLPVLMYVLFAILKPRAGQLALPLAVSIIAIPTVWQSSGIALNELPGLILLTISFGLLAAALDQDQWTRPRIALAFTAGGLVMGFAAWAKQPFILPALVAPIASFAVPRNRWLSLLAPLSAGLVLGPLLVIWGGLVSPAVHQHAGISIEHGILNFAYAAITAWIIAPGFFRFNVGGLGAIALAGVIANGLFGFLLWFPMKGLEQQLLSPAAQLWAERIGGGFLLALALLFAAALARHARSVWAVPSGLFASGALALLVAWPFGMVVQYSSRYSIMGLPFLLIVLAPYYVPGRMAALRLWAGSLLGCVTLLEYYRLSS